MFTEFLEDRTADTGEQWFSVEEGAKSDTITAGEAAAATFTDAVGEVANVNNDPKAHGDYSYIDAGISDVEIFCHFWLDPVFHLLSTHLAAIVFRAEDANNYLVLWCNLQNDRLRLYKRDAGTFTLLDEFIDSNISGSHSLKVIANGDSLEGHLDGVLRVTATESFQQTKTRHGLYNYGFRDVVQYDNFTIDSL